MRGRTLHSHTLEFEVFSEAAMRSADKWDDAFRQPKLEASATDRTGTTARKANSIVVCVRGQVRSGSRFMLQVMGAGGDMPEAMLTVLVSKEDLSMADLWDHSNQRSLLGVNDRLLRMRDHIDRQVWDSTNPGFYITAADPLADGTNMVRFILQTRPEKTT